VHFHGRPNLHDSYSARKKIRPDSSQISALASRIKFAHIQGMQTAQTVRQLIEAAGGSAAVTAAAFLAGHELTTGAIYKWRQNGIPDRYWSILMPLANATPADLFYANELARAEKTAC
jgi:hypothetical protein